MAETADVSTDWSIQDIPYNDIDVASMRHRDELFYLLAASSFVEIASDTYTKNLVDYYAGDVEVTSWLANHWEREEVAHGRALKAYVKHVWPEFDWEDSFQRFFEEYSKLCTVDEFEPTRGLEMAARCVVEMGTATYYRALHDHTEEPVLKLLATHIKNDEVRHYKHFYRYFMKYNALEGHGRIKVFITLARRLMEVRDGDAECALWHAFQSRNPAASRDGSEFKAMFTAASRLVRRNYPTSMAIKMLLKPLTLPPLVQQMINRPLAMVTQQWILR